MTQTWESGATKNLVPERDLLAGHATSPHITVGRIITEAAQWDLDSLRPSPRPHAALDRWQDAVRAYRQQRASAQSGVNDEARPIQAVLTILRRAFFLFLFTTQAGFLFLSVATTTTVTAAPLVAGIGLAVFWLGCLVLIAAAYVGGLRSGHYLLSPRSSISMMVVFGSLALSSIVGGVEFTLQ